MYVCICRFVKPAASFEFQFAFPVFEICFRAMSCSKSRKTAHGQSPGGRAQGQDIIVSAKNIVKKGEQKRINATLNDIQKNAIVWINDYLNDPDHANEILVCKEQLSNGFCKPSSHQDLNESDSFHPTYVSFVSLPKYFVAEFLHSNCGFSVQSVDLLNGTGKGGKLKHMFTNITGLEDSSHWPAEVHDKILLTKFLLKRLEDMGSREKNIKMAPDGSVDWLDICPYAFIWCQRGGLLVIVEVEHKSTRVKACVFVVVCVCMHVCGLLGV